MSSRNAHLAVLLRKAEWTISDAAFAVGGGRLSSVDLAEVLDELATTLREEMPHAMDSEPDAPVISSGTA